MLSMQVGDSRNIFFLAGRYRQCFAAYVSCICFQVASLQADGGLRMAITWSRLFVYIFCFSALSRLAGLAAAVDDRVCTLYFWFELLVLWVLSWS